MDVLRACVSQGKWNHVSSIAHHVACDNGGLVAGDVRLNSQLIQVLKILTVAKENGTGFSSIRVVPLDQQDTDALSEDGELRSKWRYIEASVLHDIFLVPVCGWLQITSEIMCHL